MGGERKRQNFVWGVTDLLICLREVIIPELSSPSESSAQIIHNPALKKMCFVQIILKKSNNLLTKDT